MFRETQSGKIPYKVLYTSNFVLDETVTRILYERGHRDALTVLGLLRADSAMRILHVSEEVEDDIDREFARYRDARVSYADCSSKVLMVRHGIETLFSFDEDFETMGLSRIP
jgi:predicted nucleic acid-binding protein